MNPAWVEIIFFGVGASVFAAWTYAIRHKHHLSYMSMALVAIAIVAWLFDVRAFAAVVMGLTGVSALDDVRRISKDVAP